VEVRLGEDRDFAMLEISDSAPGIDAEHWPHLFDRFYRIEPSRGRAGGGSGLGLAICRNIVEAHGGKISANGSSLGGLAILVRLPLEP
jgi:two-component system sensor histidine kinase BaeS